MEGLMAPVTLSIAGAAPHGHHYRWTPSRDASGKRPDRRRAGEIDRRNGDAPRDSMSSLSTFT